MLLRRRASHPTGRSAVHALSGKQPVPFKLLRARAAANERPVPLRLPRARAAAWIKSVADAAAAASVTPDRVISGARAEQRAACAAQASESESSSFDRERCRRSCGGERPTRQGDQRCAHRAASGLCRLCAAQAPESESSSLDRERSRRSCGRERHTRQGDQRCASRAASGLCRSSFREREQQPCSIA